MKGLGLTWGFPFFGCPNNKDYNMLGPILKIGVPHSGKLPRRVSGNARGWQISGQGVQA